MHNNKIVGVRERDELTKGFIAHSDALFQVHATCYIDQCICCIQIQQQQPVNLTLFNLTPNEIEMHQFTSKFI